MGKNNPKFYKILAALPGFVLVAIAMSLRLDLIFIILTGAIAGMINFYLEKRWIPQKLSKDTVIDSKTRILIKVLLILLILILGWPLLTETYGEFVGTVLTLIPVAFYLII